MDFSTLKSEPHYPTCVSALAETGELLLTVSNLGFKIDTDVTVLQKQLESPFAIFVVGEFNSGKSSLLNALAGKEIAKTGVLPTTAEVQPIDSLTLEGITFIDSPGTNSIVEGHEERTKKYLQQSDLILFVTSVERPLSESELQFIKSIREQWLRKLIVVINKIDQCSAEEVASVKDFVISGLRAHTDITPAVYLFSAKVGTGLDELKKELLSTLNQTQRIGIKFLSPQLAAMKKIEAAQVVLDNSHAVLKKEEEKLAQLHTRLAQRSDEISSLHGGYTERIKAMFKELQSRVNNVVDKEFGFLPVLKARMLGNEERLKQKIEAEIKVLNVEALITGIADDAAKSLSGFIERTSTQIGQDLSSYSADTSSTVSAITSIVVPKLSLDPNSVSEKLQQSVAKGLGQSVTLGTAAAASGIGATITSVASVELIGLLLMTVLAAFSLRALPRQREKAKESIADSLQTVSITTCEALKQEIKTQVELAFKPLIEKITAASAEVDIKIEKYEDVQSKIAQRSSTSQSLISEIKEKYNV